MDYDTFKIVIPELAHGYYPSGSSLERVANVRFLKLVGPSGVGKTSIMNQLGYPFVISDTTREARSGEISGVHYNFRTDYENILEEIEAGEYLEFAAGPVGDFYGTKATSYPETEICVKAITANAISFFRSLGFKRSITAVVTPPSYGELDLRRSRHDLTEDQKNKRILESIESFTLMLNDPEARFILNDKLHEAIVQVKALAEYSIIDHSRETRARIAAAYILGILQSTQNYDH